MRRQQAKNEEVTFVVVLLNELKERCALNEYVDRTSLIRNEKFDELLPKNT